MYPFFDLAIFPVLEAAGVRRVVEIGALRGETTARMLERLGPDAELHVIDPVPVFDPTEHERQFPGRYRFYRDLSHAVLPDLPAMDAALIDGDHNWYTVHGELELLGATARKADRPLPVLILHDVGWPYGRRDLYYAPDQIPEEHRQPYRRAGMKKGTAELLKRGGMNPTMDNAVTEGGPKNGVMTALDDFLDTYDRPVRRVLLPAYFGLAIVVEESRLHDRPELAAVLDHLESREGMAELVEIAEDMRLQAITVQHGVFFNAERRHRDLAARYLDTVKAALLNEHHLEHEIRIDHLVQIVEEGAPVFDETLRDPARQLKVKTAALRAARRAGKVADDDGEVASYLPYTTMGRARLDHLQASLTTIRDEDVKGDLVDCSPGRGGGAIFMKAFLAAEDMVEPTVWVAGRFAALAPDAAHDPAAPGGGRGFPDLLADLNNVRDGFDRFDLFDERVRFLQGDYRATLPDAPIEKIALLRLGAGLGREAGDVLEALYPRMTVGGVVVVDDVVDPATREALDAYRARHSIDEELQQVDWAAVSWRVLSPPPAAGTAAAEPAATAGRALANAPLAGPVRSGRKDLSVVIVMYDMKREAARSLHALSRAYQRDVDDLDYEVIVVENGSSPELRLGADYVRSFGAEFHYRDLGDRATSSPVPALNEGIAAARGEAFALMIDGAHVLTPGVLHYGMVGLATYAPAIVATQQWYLGPGQQGDAINDGYDQDREDRLLAEIGWPTDGYRMFDIGNFVGDRDWLDGLWESNCLFASRALLEQAGCFEESFAMPGGGYANLEIYERLGSSPDVTVATILGEGSFHQVHGGTTTNMSDLDERHRRLASYSQHYQDLRGRGFRGHGKKIHYVGTMAPDIARTRARRRYSADTFASAADGPDGRPTDPMPVAQELRSDFIEAYWKSLRWRQTSWLGQRLPKPATDLFAYQELVTDLRPDWIVETGTGNGGRAWFLASICDLLGHGRIVSVDAKANARRPTHDRITYVEGPPHEPETADRVREVVGEGGKALVILGTRNPAGKLLKEFDQYAPLVPVGSYVVVEDTIVNGHPVWAGFGRGPAEAVRTIVEARGDFMSDLAMEKYVVTFNPNGFLKRVAG